MLPAVEWSPSNSLTVPALLDFHSVPPELELAPQAVPDGHASRVSHEGVYSDPDPKIALDEA